MKNGLLVYETNHSINIFNIGDYIQSIASAQFFDDKIDCFVNREKLNSYKGDKVRLFMNGWFMHQPQNWPPSKDIIPCFVAFHINKLAEKELLSNESIEYYKKFEPIGCRDYDTVKKLKRKGVDAYFSGCMTLTLGEKYTSKQKDGSIYFTDVPQTIELTLSNLCRVVFCLIFHTCSIHKVYKRRYKDFNVTDYVRNLFFYAIYSRQFTSSVLEHAVYQKQEIEDVFTSDEEEFKYADTLLRKYAQAAYVVTSRIHCALPCIAMGTPVLYIFNENQDEVSTCRMGGLLDLFHLIRYNRGKMFTSLTKDKIGKDFSFVNKNSYKKIRTNLIKIASKFVEDTN